MDVDDDNKNTNNDIWEWHEEEYCLQRDSRSEVSHCLWDEVNVSEENFMYMLDEPTPIKDCLDLDYQLSDVGDNSKKGMEECTETSQMKRRRMLQFTSDTNNIRIDKQQITSVREGSPKEDAPSNNLEWGEEWNLGLHGTGAFNCEAWNQPSEGLLANCLNESEMHCSTNEMTDYIPSDNQVGISEFYNISPQMETDLVQNTPNSASIKVYKGRKSYLRTPKKLATTPVAYPFALIKPCGVQGDVTLGDINQRIHAPPPSRSKHLKDDNSSSPHLTSAFSGKPVVVKTKIRTEGGKGSITIMRTKG